MKNLFSLVQVYLFPFLQLHDTDQIGNLINSIDPEFIVMGGGVVNNNVKFRNLLIKHTRNYILAADVKKIKILISKLKDDTGLLGAAAVFK